MKILGELGEGIRKLATKDVSTRDLKIRIANALGVSEKDAMALLVKMKNEDNLKGIRKAKSVIVFLPQCIRKKGCSAEVTEDGIKCRECSKECQANKIRAMFAKNKKVKVAIVPGGTMLKKIMEREKPEAIVGVACLPEIEEATAMLEKTEMPVYGSILLKDGCLETIADLEEIERIAKELSENEGTGKR